MIPDKTPQPPGKEQHDDETQQPCHDAQKWAEGHDQDRRQHHQHDGGEGFYHWA